MSEKVHCFWNNEVIENTPIKYDNKDVKAIIGWGGLQLKDGSVNIVELCYEYSKAVQSYSCGQCIPCRAGTRVILDIFDKIKKGEGEESDLKSLKILCNDISKTSMCEIGQSSPKVIDYILEKYSDELINFIREKKKIDTPVFEYKSSLTAPCMQACPIHLDIPKYVEEIKYGRFEESLNIIREKLPLPGVVGRVCVRPCESNC
ncbi:MAG: formate dehydrogenase, partial [Proteobacteria bacterium]|nr:formate dehydrogenase [Pseudomonadota bacterium]